MEFIASDGVRLAYRVDGASTGAAILLLNGLFGDMGFWDLFVDDFSSDYLCIRMDQRGIGESERWSGTITYERHALDAIELLDHLAMPKVHVLGLCHGGMVGAVLARDYESRILSMASCGTRLLASSKIYLYESWRLQILEQHGLAAMASAQAPLVFGEKFLLENAPWLDAMARKNELRLTVDSAKALLLAAREFAMSAKDIAGMKVPALFLAGEEDTYCPPWTTKRSADLWPGAEFQVLPDCAHIITREAPDAFHRSIRYFLSKLD